MGADRKYEGPVAPAKGHSVESLGCKGHSFNLDPPVGGRHVIVIEDIADTGRTLDVVAERIRASGCAALLVREGYETPKRFGFAIGPGFVVGYGTDYAGYYRGLRDVRGIPGTDELR
jgi:hypoxanthine phosphoribosyltransferase